MMLALSPPELTELMVALPPQRTPFIWGPPGIGKSALVRQAGLRCGLPCVTLLGTQLAPEDLIGVPRIREEGGRHVTEFCPPRAILQQRPFLLFIDELNSAVPDVQKAFYSLILDRRLGDYELPAESRVIGAGNRIEDRALVRPMATALSNRMLHVALEPNAEAWLAWACSNGLHPLVITFVRARPDRLFEPPPTDGTPAYPTPRAWHLLSDSLHAVDASLWPAIAAGSVGDRAGAEFSAFARRARLVPRLEDLASGAARVPDDPDLAYFVGASCLSSLGSDAARDGIIAADALAALALSWKEVAVWTVDAALRVDRPAPAAVAFETHLRGADSGCAGRCVAAGSLHAWHMSTEARDKLAAARVWLMRHKPFFGVLSQGLRLRASGETPALRLYPDDRVLFNAKSVEAWPFPEVVARLAHLSLHAALGAFERRRGRPAHAWNVAHDLAIAPMLRAADLGGYLPDLDWGSPELATGQAAEEVYVRLPPDAMPCPTWFDLSDPSEDTRSDAADQPVSTDGVPSAPTSGEAGDKAARSEHTPGCARTTRPKTERHRRRPRVRRQPCPSAAMEDAASRCVGRGSGLWG